MRHRSYSLIMWCNKHERIQAPNWRRKSGPLTGSVLEAEIWSFDRAINEVFRLLPQEMCPKPTEEHTPAKTTVWN